MAKDAHTTGRPTHIPVMFEQVMTALQPAPESSYVDGTVGLGGHTQGILERSSPDGRVLGLDADPDALAHTARRLEGYGDRLVLAKGRHVNLKEIALQKGFAEVDGILLDLGVSSMQLDRAERGFSFQADGPLDMRMGPDSATTAEEIVNTWSEEDLADLIYAYGEDRLSRRIARIICDSRPLHSTRQLADLIEKRIHTRERIHPATRTFQALRIAVNDELKSLERVLPDAVDLLKPGGRLAVIAFHSLEDRIVKQFMHREARDCICPPRLPQCVCGHKASLELVSRKPLRPTEQEIAQNARSRSARLRVATKLGTLLDEEAS